MPEQLSTTVVDALVAKILENDELIGTRYTWEGEYAITEITLRKYVGPPGEA
jgi:hypothetical protein